MVVHVRAQAFVSCVYVCRKAKIDNIIFQDNSISGLYIFFIPPSIYTIYHNNMMVFILYNIGWSGGLRVRYISAHRARNKWLKVALDENERQKM